MRKRASQDADETNLDALRDLYGALGPGFPLAVKRVFEGDTRLRTDEWQLRVQGLKRGSVVADDLSSGGLFSLPPRWELTRVAAERLQGRFTKDGDVIKARGHIYCRPTGGWESERFPFIHMWTMCAGKALRFESFFDGLELRRRNTPRECYLAAA
jgi:hypothetical protein